MWKKIIISVALSFILFFIQQFINSWLLTVDVFLIVIIWLILRDSSLVWYLVFGGGILLDVAYGTFSAHLFSFIVSVYLLKILINQFSLQSTLTKITTIFIGVILNISFNYFFIKFFALVVNSFIGLTFLFSLNFILSYIIINTVLILLLSFIKDPTS